MAKPTLISRIAVVITLALLIGATILLCFRPEIFFVIFIMALAFGLVIGALVSIASDSPPPRQTPPPTRQPDTLTPLIVGLALGWWLGGGPGDGGTDC